VLSLDWGSTAACCLPPYWLTRRILFLNLPSIKTMTSLPILIVQAQLDAYNTKGIDALMLTYAPDAEQFTLHGKRIAFV
jgi:hypothetical protein